MGHGDLAVTGCVVYVIHALCLHTTKCANGDALFECVHTVLYTYRVGRWWRRLNKEPDRKPDNRWREGGKRTLRGGLLSVCCVNFDSDAWQTH